MIDFPMTELLDDSLSLMWLERHLHPDGLHCPRCGSTARRLFRAQGHLPAYRCRACNGYDTLLTGTVFAKTRPRPATLVLVLRGMAKGEPTARLARELGLSRQQLHILRQRLQTHVNATAPTDLMRGTAVEADERYQHAGEQQHASSRPQRPAGAPISAKGTAPLPTIGPSSAVSSRARRASSAGGSATTRTGRPATPSWPTTCPMAARGSLPTHGRVIVAAIRAMPRFPTVCTNGRGMITGMASARSTATPAKEQARRSARTSVRSEASTSSTSICMWRRMKPWSIRNGSPQH
jgi:transposase-like protein